MSEVNEQTAFLFLRPHYKSSICFSKVLTWQDFQITEIYLLLVLLIVNLLNVGLCVHTD